MAIIGDTKMKRLHEDLRIPKYIRLKEHIKSLISELKPHSRLPTWGEMMNTQGLSDTTIRKAIDELEAEGYLYRIQGKGTFVAERQPEYLNIGLVVPSLGMRQQSPHMFAVSQLAEMIYSVQEEARINQANLVLYLNANDLEIERHDLDMILQRDVDAAVMFYIGGARNLDCLHKIREVGIPVVMVDRYERGIEVDYVVTDNFAGAYRAVSALLDRGFSPVYHITIDEDISPVRDRLQGYRQAMIDHGLSPEGAVLVISGEDPARNRESIDRFVSEVIASADSPVGIFAVHDEMLAFLWTVLDAHNLPHSRIGLACFDNPQVDIPQDMLLVKVTQPAEEIGRKSVQLVVDKIRSGSQKVERIALEPEIVITGGDAA